MGAGLAGLAGAAGAAEGWMDLEQLGNIQVITATKQLQPVWSAPSALAVITEELESAGFGGGFGLGGEASALDTLEIEALAEE